ncbi:hypothetical protein AM493_15280 [Flavobacterium akiainvivens]|uniref:Secretion system C-terminal sorting domain-containing protein n=1 Tax=Flavobacterium akiainvivens TaxID=1202724 RepID=A0A0M9VJ13_9FLAO|nr:T9SS type A sorting domain-containing protein [Flavobacterium akiainvivens]KOS07246.1 hypothetical protein AM493_15280 [Flavobacterium akiainvivens]SFQ45579.1 Por secretion system C-terminal sorting domain-containing protein [Flavobacterium akiainvivens]
MKTITLLIACALTWGKIMAQTPVIEWKHSYGGSGHDGLAAIEPLPEGGYIVAGYTDSTDGTVTEPIVGMQDAWLLKTDNTGAILWQKTIGGLYADMPNDIALTPDGGFVIAGTNNNPGSSHGYDFLIMKTDSEGTLEWQQILGGTGFDVAHSIHPTADGGYMVAGESTSNDGDAIAGKGMSDFWVLKLTSEGTIEWQKKLGGSLNDGAWAMQPTSDGGWVVAGMTESNNLDVTGNHGMGDYWLVKLNASGNIQWQKTYGGTSIDYGIVMAAAPDGGYLLSGFAFSNDGDVSGNHGAGDMWVVKTSATGAVEWQKCLGGISNEVAYDVVVTQDGGYLLGGYAMSADGDLTANQGNADCWVVKLDATGTLLWQKSLGGSNLDYVKGLRETADGMCIMAGNSISGDGDVDSNLGNEDFWIVKLGEEVTGINTPLFKNLVAYPNPAADVLSFSENTDIITVFTPDGKAVLNSANTQSINISHLATGMYFAEAQINGVTQRLSFAKQ